MRNRIPRFNEARERIAMRKVRHTYVLVTPPQLLSLLPRIAGAIELGVPKRRYHGIRGQHASDNVDEAADRKILGDRNEAEDRVV
jgi:hypothetical protein